MQGKKYIYLGLRNGLKISKIKCSDILSMTLAHTCHRNMYTSISEKIQQEIISKVGNVCAFYNIVLIEMKIARNEYGGLFALEPLVTAYQ
jgi:uncharacterized membrane protein required for colicin V production